MSKAGFVFTIVLLTLGGLAFAESASTPQPERGPVTNLPLPRFVSLKAAEGNVRRGPSLSHRIDWVFKHRSMPLQIVAEYGNWRRVTDLEGAGGWMHYSLLSGARTVRIKPDMATLYKLADENSQIAARMEQGVIAKLGSCDDTWCKVSAQGSKGWIKRSDIWGLMPGEKRE